MLNTNKVDTTDSRLSDARTPTEHNHDDRYYTVTTAQNLLNGKLSTSGRVSYIGLDTSGLYLTIDDTNYQVPFGINTSEILRTTGGYLTGGGVISNDGNILSPVWGNDWLSNVIASKQDTSTAINAYNIGNQSVNYANSAGSASWAVQCRDESGVKIRSGSYMDVFNYADSGYQAVRAYSFNTMSSKLTKENVLPMEEDEAKKILKLNPITFDYKQNFGGQKNLRGLIAEDVLNIIPSAVSVPKNYSEENFVESDGIHNDLLSVDYSKFVPYLIKMVQIQQKEIDELKSK